MLSNNYGLFKEYKDFNVLMKQDTNYFESIPYPILVVIKKQKNEVGKYIENKKLKKIIKKMRRKTIKCKELNKEFYKHTLLECNRD